jgi:hypothetical protein
MPFYKHPPEEIVRLTGNHALAVRNHIDRYARIYIDKKFSIFMEIFSTNLYLIELIAIQLYVRRIMVFKKPDGVSRYRLIVMGKSLEELLTLTGEGYRQQRQLLIANRFVATKKLGDRVKLTTPFRQKRENMRLELVELNHQYITSWVNELPDGVYKDYMLELEQIRYDSGIVPQDVEKIFDRVPQALKEPRQIDVAGIFKEDIRLSSKELHERVREIYKIGVSVSKSTVKALIQNKIIVRKGGKKKSPNSYFIINNNQGTEIETHRDEVDFLKILQPLQRVKYNELVVLVCKYLKRREQCAKKHIQIAIKDGVLVHRGKAHHPAAYYILNPERFTLLSETTL